MCRLMWPTFCGTCLVWRRQDPPRDDGTQPKVTGTDPQRHIFFPAWALHAGKVLPDLRRGCFLVFHFCSRALIRPSLKTRCTHVAGRGPDPVGLRGQPAEAADLLPGPVPDPLARAIRSIVGRQAVQPQARATGCAQHRGAGTTSVAREPCKYDGFSPALHPSSHPCFWTLKPVSLCVRWLPWGRSSRRGRSATGASATRQPWVSKDVCALV
jgi:hypothetical protein